MKHRHVSYSLQVWVSKGTLMSSARLLFRILPF